MCFVYNIVADSGSCDRPIDPTNQNQYIVWGIGSLGATAFQHHTRATGMYVGGRESEGTLSNFRGTYYSSMHFYMYTVAGTTPSALTKGVVLCIFKSLGLRMMSS